MKYLIIEERKSEYLHHLVRVGWYESKLMGEYSFIQELTYFHSDGKLKQHTITIGYEAAKRMMRLK